ncbi:MAG: TIGR01777 family oxidoreductase [Desulfomonilaceae bacterium]
MNVFLTGANGFVGTNLARFLIESGHKVFALVRNPSKATGLPKEVTVVIGESTKQGKWQEALDNYDLFINLAGANIFRRWDEDYKKLLRDSRINTTRNLVDAMTGNATLLSASAVGYYGMTEDEELDESSGPGNDFLAQLAVDWENEALKASNKGARVVITRFGVVLGRDGGALAQMIRPFKFFAGGPIGSGRQWMSWIHIIDLCRAALFAAENEEIRGPVNLCAPGPIRNGDLAKEIGKILGRPSFMPAPGFIVNLAMGEFGSVILKGQRVVPGKLQKHGFSFIFPDIKSALSNLLK